MQYFVLALLASVVVAVTSQQKCLNKEVYKQKMELVAKKCPNVGVNTGSQSVHQCGLEALNWVDSEGNVKDKTTFVDNLKPLFTDVLSSQLERIVDGCWKEGIKFEEIEKCMSPVVKKVCDVDPPKTQ